MIPITTSRGVFAMEPFNEEIGSHHSWGLVLAVVMLTAGVIALAVTTTHFATQRNEARRELTQERGRW